MRRLEYFVPVNLAKNRASSREWSRTSMETITKGQAKMTYPKVSIIILNWNGLEYTIECLESLQKITYPNYKVIVVDNGSMGNDAEVLQERLGAYIHLIKNDNPNQLQFVWSKIDLWRG